MWTLWQKYMTSFLFLEFLILDISEFVGFHSYILLNQALDFMPLGHKYDISIFLSKICTLSMFTPDHLYWVVPPPHEPAPPTNYATIPQYNPQYQPNTITPMYLEIYAQLHYHTHNVPRDIYPTSLQYPKLLTTKHAFGKILFLYCWHSLHQSEHNLSNYWWQELWNYIGAIKWKKC